MNHLLADDSHEISSLIRLLNPLLNKLFLDHDIIFLYLDNIEKNSQKISSKVLNNFEKYYGKWSFYS